MICNVWAYSSINPSHDETQFLAAIDDLFQANLPIFLLFHDQHFAYLMYCTRLIDFVIGPAPQMDLNCYLR